ncbi:MFS transporter [Massilia sp. TS11]|uniref:MFS transporter n=1 Tax=Massilia sp. TS11 TaxID=2908003 RepID=UPI001ED9CE3B|nr:MFS transporter [Massilia sp. TS11]MCG2586265.1 MFS transporter [Massilia sp. TS11]
MAGAPLHSEALPGQAPLGALRLAGCVFLPYALGHFLSSALRTVNAVLAPEMMASLGLDATGLGWLTSVFFFSFALVQLPIGLALDRFGPRRVQPVLLALAACGAWLFARAESLMLLALARALLGVGLGGCFMSAVKALATWVAPARLPSVQGYLIAAGGLGAASATLPARALLPACGWRGVFLLLACAALLVALAIWLLAPRAHARPAGTPPAVAAVLRTPAFWRTARLMLLPHAVFFGIQGLWIGRWLSDVAHLSDQHVAWLLYLGMAGVIFGAIGVGMLTEWAARRGIAALDLAAAGVALFVLVQLAMVAGYVPAMPLLSVAFTLLGTFTGMDYAIVAAAMPRSLTGRAATCLNLLIFSVAFLVQAGFGQLLGLWRPLGGHAPETAWRVALACLVALQLPGLLVYLRERRVESGSFIHHCKEDHETAALRPPR